jgi:hypothetical protein
MELEQMKQLWQQHDKRLEHNAVLNEKIITELLKDRSGGQMRRMLNWEYLNTAVYALLVVLYVAMWGKLPLGSLMVCYIGSLAFIAAGLLLGIYKIRRLSAIDFGSRAVTATQRELENFRILMLRERALGLILSPFLLVAIYAVVNYWVHQKNLFDHLSAYAPRIIIAVVVLIAAGAFAYRMIYFDTIRKLKANLREIEQFVR